jgi:hypothetical protein
MEALKSLNTDLKDVASGAAVGAIIGHFLLSGENKLKDGAVIGAGVVVLFPVIKGFVTK